MTRFLPELLLTALLLLSPPAAGSAGMVLPVAPAAAPGRVSPAPDEPLAVARLRYLEGDYGGVVVALSPWLDSRRGPWGRERVAGQLLMGLAQMELGNWNLASTAFYQVRRADSPLASYGAWYEAVVDHQRGRHAVAASECAAYRSRWPDGPEADNCLLLIGDASAAAGNRGASVAAYRAYLDKHPDTARDEEIRLGLALAEASVNPDRAIPQLIDLVLSHSWHSTALAAQEALDALAARGYDTALPTDTRARMRQCESARRCGRFDEAWAIFQELSAKAEDDPEIAAWVERNEDRVAWGTRQYDRAAAAMEADYAAKPSASLAWRIFTAWGREGDWKKAVSWAARGKQDFPTSGQFRRMREEIAWAITLAGDYAEAQAAWGELGKAGNKEARFYEAFTAFRAGDLEAAEKGLSAVISRDPDRLASAAYWRSKVRSAKQDEAGAAEDRATVARVDRHGWYRLLLESPALTGPDVDWRRRDGTWRGGRKPALPALSAPTDRPLPSTGLWPSALAVAQTEDGDGPSRLRPALEVPAARDVDWRALRWTGKPVAPAPAAVSEAPPIAISEEAPPDGVAACAWYDPVAAQKDFFQLAEANAALLPNLRAAYDLSLAGLYEESSRLVGDAFDAWDRARQGTSADPAAAAIAALNIKSEQWRAIFLFARDNYHAVRFCSGLDRGAASEAERIAVARLAWPIVRGADLWRLGREFGVDPLLMLGLMRQESSYKPTALSSANAVGLVQVLPSTGARMAAALGETRYSPGDLEIPSKNLRYGVYYFSLLLKRFDNVFPLAVASYNGGPHNVSRWYKGHQGQVDLDVFVEQIPYPETRDYVKRVTGNYATYVDLYGPPGAAVMIPPRPLGDDPSVVNY